MKQFLFLAGFLIIITSCNNRNSTGTQNNGDETFQKLSDDFLQGFLAWRPQAAVALGLHEYDGKITDYSMASVDSELHRLKEYDEKLTSFDTAKVSLNANLFYDLRILRAAVKNEIFNFEGMKAYTNNPMTYAGAVDLNVYIKRNYAPLEDRLRSIIAVEEKVPALYEAARTNLVDSLAKPYIETAIGIAEGAAGFLKSDLLIALKEVKNDSLMAKFKDANNSAITAINGFVDWLKKEKLPKANNNYAIGEENYKKMLLYAEDLDMTPEAILQIGLKELKRNQEIFNKAAAIIDPTKKPVDVYHATQKEHPTADRLLPNAREHLEMIRKFLAEKNIVTMPSEVRVQVKETPPYARSTSTASMDTPGPFEKNATEAYYYITPVDATWTAKQKEDWLSSFDYYTTDNVTIHEAYPGHYTQFLHLNASSASRIEKIFGSYAFIEGWAHYCEEMMSDEGYGNTGDSVTAAKYRIAMAGDALLRICRLCVSIKMHCQGMTVDEGTKFFMDNWHQGDKPSRQEALRGTFDPGYLFYTVGKLEILKLREDFRKQEGTNFSLKNFHDQFLDHGMPPVQLVREILLKDKESWGEVL